MPEVKKERRNSLLDTVITVVEALLIALVIRTFLIQNVNIPSGSMEPTLLIGDYLFISKFSYGYSRYSFPFGPPLFSGRIFGSEPNRGDIIVFRHEEDDFIKRLIGLPGDRIQVVDGALMINGAAIERHQIEDFVGDDPCRSPIPGAPPVVVHVPQWRETLPNGVSYTTLKCSRFSGFPNTTDVYTVPPGHYFMMGDNRDNSEDSRFPDVGYVPFENLVGHAQVIFFSIGDGHAAWEIWTWPWSARWGRLFTLVR
jgi:signal peptidase I